MWRGEWSREEGDGGADVAGEATALTLAEEEMGVVIPALTDKKLNFPTVQN